MSPKEAKQLGYSESREGCRGLSRHRWKGSSSSQTLNPKTPNLRPVKASQVFSLVNFRKVSAGDKLACKPFRLVAMPPKITEPLLWAFEVKGRKPEARQPKGFLPNGMPFRTARLGQCSRRTKFGEKGSMVLHSGFLHQCPVCCTVK